jgi:polysaccharide export outer membrane protein
VLGEVKSPGRFNYGDRMTIVEAVTLAGGFTTLAERNYAIVTRGEAAGTRRVAVPVEKIMQGLAANFLLQPGDIVFVPETIL